MPSYDDEDFLDLLDTEKWAPAYYIANRLGCAFQTANRRLIQLANDDVVEVFDPDANEYGVPKSSQPSRPTLHYRKVPNDRDPLTGEIDDE